MAEAKAQRFGLVIGNAKYPVSPLRNPGNDATSVGNKLVSLGFEVRTEIDLTAERFRQVVAEFCRTVGEASAKNEHTQAVLFYAGHGVQVDGENFLVPLDGQVTTKFELKQTAIGLDILLEALGACARTSIVMLDCCRDNPLPRTLGSRSLATSQGLANVRAPKGVYVAFATQPHFVALDGAGNNSPFTEALIEHIADPAKHVTEVLMDVRKDVYEKTAGQQIPWDHSALFEPFIFSNVDASSLPESTDFATRDRVYREQEKAREEGYWTIAKRSNDTDLIQSFVTQFPNSANRSLALSRIDQIKNRSWMRILIPISLVAAGAALYLLWLGSLYFRMQTYPDADIIGGDVEIDGSFGYAASTYKCRLDCLMDLGQRRCIAFSYDVKGQMCYPKFEAVFYKRPSIDGGDEAYSEVVPGMNVNLTASTYQLIWDRSLMGTPVLPDTVRKTPGAETAIRVDDPNTKREYWDLRGPDCQRVCNSLGEACKGFSYTRSQVRCELYESVRGITRDGAGVPVHVPGTFSGCSDPKSEDCKGTLERAGVRTKT